MKIELSKQEAQVILAALEKALVSGGVGLAGARVACSVEDKLRLSLNAGLFDLPPTPPPEDPPPKEENDDQECDQKSQDNSSRDRDGADALARASEGPRG